MADRLSFRAARPEDAETLCAWWNDGAVMAHAGFPRGLGTTAQAVRKKILAESDGGVRRYLIEYDGAPVGEMSARSLGGRTCEIGIKLCRAEYQNRGLGKVILSRLIRFLLDGRGFERIVLSTTPENLRARHVYERLGFCELRVNEGSWVDQEGNPRSSVEYELTRETFRDLDRTVG